MTSWSVSIDAKLCTFCEVCVEKCPRDAFIIERSKGAAEIIFDAAKCDGCENIRGPKCKVLCPEAAIKIEKTATAPRKPAPLVKFAPHDCSKCGATFFTRVKIVKVLRRKNIRRKSVHGFCPDCRRKSLVEGFLNEVAEGKHKRGSA